MASTHAIEAFFILLAFNENFIAIISSEQLGTVWAAGKKWLYAFC